ncbi:hypothetical protein J2S34_001566 [Nitrobacter winogradskyi]|uniref:Uncharacterized protein n=1 Tax=Nitrobacter winogradskyi TaxID=913 RepID=A0ACC6AHG1_NITWI|nr:hypothetical protein [Nitrobacter winogradskyi]
MGSGREFGYGLVLAFTRTLQFLILANLVGKRADCVMISAFVDRSGKWRLPARFFIRCRQPGFGLISNLRAESAS